MTSNEIRKSFLEFFRQKQHVIVPASPLVPANDPTLLFTNAGMVQFKDVFLGREKPAHLRVADVQPCLRAGGKHNDLENVGYTARHHTFFEMLGNWSFGDYFKREAILYAWELLTKVWKLAPERMWITVYKDDDEAYKIWTQEVGVPKERVVRVGDNHGAPYASDNFWQMADTGPCGPCTEIFWDHGPDLTGGPPGSPDEGDRYVEIWNLVFMQFDRAADGKLTKLPKPCVDTGMGLERMGAVLQGVHSNYDIDMFKHLIQAAAQVTGAKDLSNPSLRVIADHIRACTFLIADGVLPSNEGRGYVLRRIIRRAVRHFYKLCGISWDGYFWRMVEPLVKEMSGAYPQLKAKQEFVEQVLRNEEKSFVQTLDSAMMRLNTHLIQNNGKLTGEELFQLHDTYGCPPDLIADVLREKKISISSDALSLYDQLMEQQRQRGRAASQFGAEYAQDVDIQSETRFTGYDTLKDTGKIVALFRGKDEVKTLKAGEQGMVILDHTPFYAESGGQVGDQGELLTAKAVFKVEDTQKRGGGAHAHLGKVIQGELKVGEAVDAQVDEALRAATVLNHSATHLLHAALRQVLGTHVTQKGSLVAPDRLRFDFSHPQPVSTEQLQTIEDLVNREIHRNAQADVRQMKYDEAIQSGAMALFGEKYGDNVRVLRFGDFSTELCGGTHVRHVGDIGFFKITSESGVAAGVRRVEALTGEGALNWVHQAQATLRAVAELTKSGPDKLEEKVSQLLEHNRKLEKELQQLKGQLASRQGGDLASTAVDVKGLKVLAARLDGADAKTLRDTVDQLKNKLGSAAIVLGAVEDGKVRLVAGVTADRMQKIKAGDLVNHVAEQVGGKGGGRPDMAQAGGNEPEKLDTALQSVPAWVRAQLG
ncbi:MAG: alanine--tRNA ligase [Gammaproteobacteria bacterium]|nr:alanine--tRNA ligase [Gammaproteobacteria bacterium]